MLHYAGNDYRHRVNNGYAAWGKEIDRFVTARTDRDVWFQSVYINLSTSR